MLETWQPEEQLDRAHPEISIKNWESCAVKTFGFVSVGLSLHMHWPHTRTQPHRQTDKFHTSYSPVGSKQYDFKHLQWF